MLRQLIEKANEHHKRIAFFDPDHMLMQVLNHNNLMKFLT